MNAFSRLTKLTSLESVFCMISKSFKRRSKTQLLDVQTYMESLAKTLILVVWTYFHFISILNLSIVASICLVQMVSFLSFLSNSPFIDSVSVLTWKTWDASQLHALKLLIYFAIPISCALFKKYRRKIMFSVWSFIWKCYNLWKGISTALGSVTYFYCTAITEC